MPGPLFAETLYEAPGWQALGSRPEWIGLLAAIVLTAVGVAIAAGLRERSANPRGWPLLLGLRLIAIAAAASVLVGLQRRETTQREDPSRVVLLVDRSASMRLPSGVGSDASSRRDGAVEPALAMLTERLGQRHRVRRAGFDVAVDYTASDASDAGDDENGAAERSAGEATRLGAALDRVLSDHAGAPLAAIVVASDGGWNAGPDPTPIVAAAAERGVEVHLLGVGPLRPPTNVGLRDVAAPSRAAVGDPFRVSVTAARTGADPAAAEPATVLIQLRPLLAEDEPGGVVAERAVEIELSIDGSGVGVGVASVELSAPDAGRYLLSAEVAVGPEDADATDNRIVSEVELASEPTRVLLASGGPGRDYRFLRDQLYRDELFTLEVHLQSAVGAVTQDAGRVLDAMPASEEELEAYDALVAIDLDWRDVDEAAQQALSEWVADRGGGLVFVGGRVGVPASVRAGLTRPLRALLPVVLRDDPLALTLVDAATPTARPVRLTPLGEAASFLEPPTRAETGDGSAWDRFPGFYAGTLPAEPKAGATPLAEFGGASQERREPVLVEHFFGAGRVAYLASAETWRLRGQDPGWFASLHTGLLRRVSQGRLRGTDAVGALMFGQARYDVGDTVTLRYVVRTASPGGAEPTARVTLGEGAPDDHALTPVEGQPGVYAATFPAASAGVLRATLALSDRRSLRASAEVELPRLEAITLTQDAALLRELAAIGGGRYLDISRWDSETQRQLNETADAIPSRAETITELGPPDEEFARQMSTGALTLMAACLLIEWSLRRLWRLA